MWWKMKINKIYPIFLLVLLSIQFLIGVNYFSFINRDEKDVNIIDPKLSDVIVGNYTVPGVSGSIQPDQIVKIGLLDDMGHFSGDHAWMGALLAAREINQAGGITISSVNYYIGLAAEDTNEASAVLDVPETVAVANRMVLYNDPHFIIGGFRNDAVDVYREVVMDAQIPFLGTGAASDDFCKNVTDNYARYKYFFRVMPMNATSLGSEIVTYTATLCNVLNSTFGGTFSKIAILREDLPWSVPLG